VEQVTSTLKNAGYEVKKRAPKVGDVISFKKSIVFLVPILLSVVLLLVSA